MSWCTIREYTASRGLSDSTVRRRIREGRLFARKFGRSWFVDTGDSVPQAEVPHPQGAVLASPESFAPAPASGTSSLQSVVEFSSKALHHYLLLSEKLASEKDARLSEKDQRIAELEAYVRMLERELDRVKGTAWRG